MGDSIGGLGRLKARREGQGVLFSGLGCLPGQGDLFEVDGCESGEECDLDPLLINEHGVNEADLAAAEELERLEPRRQLDGQCRHGFASKGGVIVVCDVERVAAYFSTQDRMRPRNMRRWAIARDVTGPSLSSSRRSHSGQITWPSAARLWQRSTTRGSPDSWTGRRVFAKPPPIEEIETMSESKHAFDTLEQAIDEAESIIRERGMRPLPTFRTEKGGAVVQSAETHGPATYGAATRQSNVAIALGSGTLRVELTAAAFVMPN